MAEPLNTYQVTHHLEFDGQRYRIAEPTKFDAANFVLKQENKRYGRDVSFASGSVDLSFNANVSVDGYGHQFDRLINEYQTNGFEANVKYIISIYGADYVIGQLDFKEANTDLLTYFDCKVIQETSQALLKRRLDVKVNVFDDRDLDDNLITPLVAEDVMVKATPLNQVSEWVAVGDYTNSLLSSIEYAVSLVPQLERFEVDGTRSPLYGVRALSDTDDVSEMYLIDAETNLTGLTLALSDWTYSFSESFPDPTVKLYYEIGLVYGAAGNQSGEVDLEVSDTDFSTSLTLPGIERGEKLWVFLKVNNTGAGINNISFTSGTMTLTATSTSFSSVVKGFKLYDVMKYVVKSISGLEIDAPRFKDGGNLDEQYLTNGLLMRSEDDKPFNISLKEIIGHLPEFNGDYEVLEDKVFFGLYDDFYRDVKIGEFDEPTSVNFVSGFNDLYSINTLEWKYKKYEKENDEDRSRKGVHTELQLLLPNKEVENTKQVSCEFIRDAYLIEKTRRDALRINDDTATNEDESVFIIDTVQDTASFSEVFYVQHVLVESGTVVRLLSDGTFRWDLLGISAGQFVTIDGDNAGDYLVGELDAKYIELTAVGASNPTFEGYELTTMTYNAEATTTVNRTNEGFDIISGLVTDGGMANLNFTPKRNLLNFYGSYLLACCQFRQTKNIKVTEFIHNGALQTKKADEGLLIREDADIDLAYLAAYGGLAKMTPYLIQCEVLCDFTTFWQLRHNVRTQRGYIEVMDTLGNTIKVHPKELDYNWADNILSITGEVRNVVGSSNNLPDIVPENGVRYMDGTLIQYMDGSFMEFYNN